MTSPDSSRPQVDQHWRDLFALLPGYDPELQAGDCWFDPVAAQFAVDFFHNVLKHAKGKDAGKPFILEPWEQAIVGCLWGWKRQDGTRRYRELFLYVAKKNGKSALIAGLLLLSLTTDNEQGGEYYSAAASRDQAALIFAHCIGMVKQERELSSRLTVYGGAGGSQQRSIVYPDLMASYKCLAADANTADGTQPCFVAIDELHRHKTPDLADVLAKSTAAGRQPLIITTTTADYDRESACNDKLAEARRVLANKGDQSAPGYDPAFLPVIYEASIDDDYTSPETWTKANPNLGVTVGRDFFEREVRKAKENPSALNSFLRLHLNIVTQVDQSWIDLSKWDLCDGLQGDETPGEWRDRMMNELAGRRCFIGMDLSAKIDITAVVAIFPPIEPKEPWRILPWFWVPGMNATDLGKRDGVPYAAWERGGFVEMTSGNEVDSQAIRSRINVIAKQFSLAEVGFDEWNATEIARQLRDEDGIEVTAVRQGSKTLSGPMKELEAMTAGRRIEHGGNPVMRWMLGNVAVKRDENDSIQPNKRKSTGRIDGVVALVSGLARALAVGEGVSGVDNIYDEGLMVI